MTSAPPPPRRPSDAATRMASLVDEAIPYHRLARARPRYRWWRVLLTGVVGAVLYAVMLLMILVPLGIASALTPELARSIDEMLTTMAFFDLDRPWLFLALVVPLILMIPALLLASRMIQGRGVGLLAAVTGRLRWGWLGRTLLLAHLIFVVYFAATLAVAALTGVPVVARADHPGIPLMIVLVVLLIPFQAAAEEYVFRGYLMQLIGAWLRHPAFAILLPVPLFVLGHNYDIWGAVNIGVFAAIAGWLSWRTGGLEAAISLHIANNVLIFLLASFSLVDANATAAAPWDALATCVVLAVYAAIADRWARREGITRTLQPRSSQAAVSSSASRIV